MNKNIKNIIKEKIIFKKIQKREIYIKILKSISQNNNIKCKLKNYTFFFLNKKLTNVTYRSKKKKICFLTGKRGGFLGQVGFSRHTIKKLILNNRFTNLKKNNF